MGECRGGGQGNDQDDVGLAAFRPPSNSTRSNNDRMMSVDCGRVASSVKRAGSSPIFLA